ncbi:MAG: hypothetical protein LUH43_05325 [Clostridia bacterium]|nr:hypothetical protein [Clostridia bacterium]
MSYQYITGKTEIQGREVTYRLYAGIPYVKNPNAPHLQLLNLYVPKEAAGKKTAPIYLYQETGGMGEAKAPTLEESYHGIVGRALADGFVVACPGARGRDTCVDGVYVGRGDLPMTIIDLKAAIRFLRHSRDWIPGDTDKIFFDGASSGGGMAALLGSTGNNAKYEKYLAEIGAYEERDDIFCAIVNSPITDFEHIDIAYEWLFSADRVNGLYEGNEKDAAVSRLMANAYESYVNSLELSDKESGAPLCFASTDTYSPYLMKKLSEAATFYLSGLSEEERDSWMREEHNRGVLTWNNGEAAVTDLKNYVNWNTGRWMRYLGCYDGFFSHPSRENQAFGERDGSLGHFSTVMGKILAGFPAYEKEGKDWLENAKLHTYGEYLVNPMNFIGTEETVTVAPHWYMRCGCHHETTGNLFLNLALRVINYTDADVNWRFSWNMPHTGISDIEADEAFDYFRKICDN